MRGTCNEQLPWLSGYEADTVGGERCACCIKIIKNPSLSCEDDFPKGVPSRSYLGRKKQ